jgi:hypothetical protein
MFLKVKQKLYVKNSPWTGGVCQNASHPSDFQKGIDKFHANVGFVVLGVFLFSQILLEFSDEFGNDRWRFRHETSGGLGDFL